MHIRKFTRITSLLLVMVMFASLLPSPTAFAAGNTVYVTPSSQSMQNGASFTIQVKGNVDTPAFNGQSQVSGTLNFPKNLLKVTSVSTSGATMNWQVSATPNNTNGTVTFNERSFFPVLGQVHIMSVTFQAIAAGTAAVGFSAATGYGAFGGGAALSGGSYTITTPPPATCPAGQVGTPPNCTNPPPAKCPTGQVGTPPNCTTPPPAKCPTGQTGTPPNCKTPTPSTGGGGSTNSGNQTPTTPAPVTPTPTEPIPAPQENGLSISDASTTRSYSTASLNWKTSSGAKNTVTYGTSLRQLDKTAEVTSEADGTYMAKFTDLTPGKRYYFTINAESEKDATKTSTYSGVFTTKGFPVAIAITENGESASNAKIKISEQNYSTDKSGKISFELAAGSYTIEVTTSKSSKKFTLAVAEKTIPDTQNFTFDVPTEAAASGGLSPFALLGIGVGAIATIGILGGLFLFWKRRKTQQQEVASVDTDYAWSAQQPLPAFPQEQAQATPLPNAAATTPIDMGYAAPPDMAPPQEIMPPDQAVAMAMQDLPPTPDDLSQTADPSQLEAVEAAPATDLIDPVQQEAAQAEQPLYNMPPLDQPLPAMLETEPPSQTLQQSDTYIDPEASPTAETAQNNAPTAGEASAELSVTPESNPATSEPTSSIMTGEPAPDQFLENESSSTPTGEPGLTETPPTTESGKGELQIDHHQEDSTELDEDTPDTSSRSTSQSPAQ